MKRVVIGIASFLVLAVIGLFLYLSLTDFSEYRTDIEEAVSEATGREFRIGGDFTLDIFPPVFVAENVSWSNADWGSPEPMLSLGHVTLRIDGDSVLFGPLVIEEFLLRDVRVLVEEDGAGRSNWAFEPDPDDEVVEVEVEADGNGAILLKHVEIENVAVIRRRPGEDDREYAIARLDVRTTDEDYLQAEAAGRIGDQAVSLRGHAGPVDNLASGRDVDISLEADFGYLAATLNGNTGDLETLDGTTLEARVTSDDIAAVAELLGLPLNGRGPLRAEAAVRAIDGLPFVKFDAGLDNLDAGGSVLVDDNRLTVDVAVSSLPAAGALADIDGLPPGPASAKGDIVIDDGQVGLIDFVVETSLASVTTTLNAVFDDDRVTLDPFGIRSGESDLSGTLSVRTAEPLQVSGVLRSTLLDLTPLTGADQSAGEPAAQAPRQDAADDGLVLSDEPLPFDLLNAANMDLALSIGELRNGPMQLRQVEGSVRLAGGTLSLDGGLEIATGGEADASITLASLGDTATLDADFELSGFRPTGEGTGERAIEDIPLLGLSADIESSGNTVHAIAAAANGRIIFTQGPGKVDNRALGLFSSDLITELLTSLNPFAKDEPYSNWECTVLGVELDDGVGTISSMLAQSEKVTIVGGGQVDFNDESLDIGFNTKPRQGVGISADMFLTPFIRLGGTLASPRLALDKKGVLISGGAAVLTGGLSFLVQGAADRATGAEDRCEAALALARGESVEAGEERPQ